MNSIPFTRVALLYYGHTQHRKALELVANLADESILLQCDHEEEALCEVCSECDLILIEAHRQFTARQRQAIRWIRAGSLAPIVVLTSDKPNEYPADTIRAGADAVLSLQLASDVILAHCEALMRRWRAHPYRTYA
jgi:DNA-binding NarL/FixJ family response regulator